MPEVESLILAVIVTFLLVQLPPLLLLVLIDGPVASRLNVFEQLFPPAALATYP